MHEIQYGTKIGNESDNSEDFHEDQSTSKDEAFEKFSKLMKTNLEFSVETLLENIRHIVLIYQAAVLNNDQKDINVQATIISSER